MNIPITKRVMNANSNGCGCSAGCNCGSAPTKQVSKFKKGLTMAGEGAREFIGKAHRDLPKVAYNTAERVVNYARENAGAIAGGAMSGVLGAWAGGHLDKKYKKSVGQESSAPNPDAKMTKDTRPVRKKVKSVSAGLKPKGITNPAGVGKMGGPKHK